MASGYKHSSKELWSQLMASGSGNDHSPSTMNSYRTPYQTSSQNAPCKLFLGASESLAFSKVLLRCPGCFSFIKYLMVNLSPLQRANAFPFLFYWQCFVLESFIPCGRLLSPYLPHLPTQSCYDIHLSHAVLWFGREKQLICHQIAPDRVVLKAFRADVQREVLSSWSQGGSSVCIKCPTVILNKNDILNKSKYCLTF